MMGGMNTIMGMLMGLMVGYWMLVSLLVLVVLGLLAVWLFQQVRCGPAEDTAASTPETGA